MTEEQGLIRVREKQKTKKNKAGAWSGAWSGEQKKQGNYNYN